ncbi:Hypothetical protein, putative [Bodo saltans]|uniref:PDZ domain-containing protein n=1 Tax=Bodo saltans TaxID=75058 RepID=A0A0S4K0S0_BODSA|nr:Hypothetical protein, putative [Bodo saltans]|eukprot:CUG94411.1 Hypothetical protein, putative [Bodo saltans]
MQRSPSAKQEEQSHTSSYARTSAKKLQQLLDQFSVPQQSDASDSNVFEHQKPAAAATSLRLSVDISPLQRMLGDVVDVMRSQHLQIEDLQERLQRSEDRHAQEMASLRREFDQKMAYTVDHVATAMDAVRRETTASCQRALPDAQAIPAILDRVRRTEEALESQRQLNAQHHVEFIALSNNHGGLTSPASGFTPQSRGMNYSSFSPMPTSEVSIVGGGEVEQLRRDVDDLLALFEIPNVFSARTQRSLTSTSLHRVAALGSDKRVQFLHALPAFHSIWIEMHRLFEQSHHPDGRGSVGAGGLQGAAVLRPTSPTRGRVPPQQKSLNSYASPFVGEGGSARWEDFLYDGRGNSEVQQPTLQQSAARPTSPSSASQHRVRKARGPPITVTTDTTGGSVTVAVLGADVANHSGATSSSGPARGVVVLRLAHGGALEASGATVGDVLTHVNDTAIAGSFHLLDIMNEYARDPQRHSCTVSLVPAGRTQSLPVSVRISLATLGNAFDLAER